MLLTPLLTKCTVALAGRGQEQSTPLANRCRIQGRMWSTLHGSRHLAGHLAPCTALPSTSDLSCALMQAAVLDVTRWECDTCGWGNKQRLRSRLERLLRDVPSEWKGAAEAYRSSQEQGGEGQAPTERDALLVLLPRLGWQVPGMGRLGRTGLRRLTVRLATVLQLTEVSAARSEQHARRLC